MKKFIVILITLSIYTQANAEDVCKLAEQPISIVHQATEQERANLAALARYSDLQEQELALIQTRIASEVAQQKQEIELHRFYEEQCKKTHRN